MYDYRTMALITALLLMALTGCERSKGNRVTTGCSQIIGPPDVVCFDTNRKPALDYRCYVEACDD